MNLHAAIALSGLSNNDVVDDVVEQIRSLLHLLDPNIDVGVEVRSIGSEFVAEPDPNALGDLLVQVEQRRRELLRRFWRERDRMILQAALRLGHITATMNATRIRVALERVDNEFS